MSLAATGDGLRGKRQITVVIPFLQKRLIVFTMTKIGEAFSH